MKQLPHSIDTSKKILYPAEQWCQEQWGERWTPTTNREGTWSVFWGGNRTVELVPSHYRWHFATEEQLAWFKLRWS